MSVGQSATSETVIVRLTRGELEAVIIGTEASRLKPLLRPERWDDAGNADYRRYIGARPIATTSTRGRPRDPCTHLDKGAHLMEKENLLEATIAVGDPFDTTRAPAVMVTEDTTDAIRADLVRQFRRGVSELVDRWSEVDDVTAFDQINPLREPTRSLEALAATLLNLAHLPDEEED